MLFELRALALTQDQNHDCNDEYDCDGDDENQGRVSIWFIPQSGMMPNLRGKKCGSVPRLKRWWQGVIPWHQTVKVQILLDLAVGIN